MSGTETEWAKWYRDLAPGDEIVIEFGNTNTARVTTEVARVNSKSITAKCPDFRFDDAGWCVGPGRHTEYIRLRMPSKIDIAET